MRGSFDLSLAPSAIYPSPPPRLVLSYGDGSNGTGLDLQLPARTGTAPTSDEDILTLTIELGGEPVAFSSLEGECEVTLEEAGVGGVRGSFRCEGLHPQLQTEVALDASGRFTASP